MRYLIVGTFLMILAACGSEEAAVQKPASATPVESSVPGSALVEPARIDRAIGGFVETGELVGVSALVFEDGKEAYFGAFGMADRETGRKIDRDTLVQIFSMTKPLTGVTLMTLYEQGLFELDDPLEKHLPEYSSIQVYKGEEDGEVLLDTPARAPTIRDIMRHTAGFANGNDDDQTWVGNRYRKVDPGNIQNTLEQMSAKLASVPLLFEPGTRWYYGPSVDVQARLVEVLTGEPFQEVLQKRVLDPLGMGQTQFTLSAKQRERITGLYWREPDGSFARIPDDEALEFSLQEWPMKPGGWGLTSTLDDFMRFARMLLNGGELDGARILQAETVSLMASDAMPGSVEDKSWLPNKGHVGFGIDFAVRTAPPADQAAGSGAVGEYFWDGAANTLFWVDPKNDIAAVLFNYYMPFGKVEIMKDFRDAVYFHDEEASSLNKAPAGPDSRRLSD